MTKHTLNFNPICNTVEANNAAADAMRSMAISVQNIEKWLEEGVIDADCVEMRIAGVLKMHLSGFDAKTPD